MAATILYAETKSSAGNQYKAEIIGRSYAGLAENVLAQTASTVTVEGDITEFLSVSLACNVLHATTPGLDIFTTVLSWVYNTSTKQTTITLDTSAITANHITFGTGGAPSFEVTMKSLTTDYEGEGDEILNPLKASTTDFTFYNTRGAVSYWLNRYKYDAEDEYVLKISEWNGASYDLLWIGNVINDNISWNNEDQPEISVKAIDGIGRLKDLKYGVIFTSLTTKLTLMRHLQEILDYNNLSAFWGASDVYIEESIEWDSGISIMDATNGPLENTRCQPNLFFDRDSTDTREALTCQQALIGLLDMFRARIFHANGRYYIKQVRNDDGTSYNYRGFYVGSYTSPDVTGTRNPVLTVGGRDRAQDLVMMGGGSYSYFSGLAKASVNIKRGKIGKGVAYGSELLLQVVQGTPETDTVSLPDVISGDGARIDFKVDSGTANVGSYLDISVNLNNATWYLRQPLGMNGSFTNTGSDRGLARVYQSGVPQIVSIYTPNFPVSDDFDLTVTYTPVNAGSGNFFTVDFMAVYFPVDGEVFDDEEIVVENPTTGFSEELKLPDLRLIDYWGNSSLLTLEVRTATGPDVWAAAKATWDGGYGISTNYLSKIGVLEAMALQHRPMEKLFGTLEGLYQPQHSLDYDDKYYCFNGGSFDYQMDEFSGEWFEVAPELSGLSFNEIKEINPDVNGEQAVNDLRNTFYQNNYWSLALTSADVAAAGSVTSIPITATGHTRIKDGDTILLVHPTSGATIESFTVNGDVSAAATSITVDSKALSDLIPVGSYVNHNPSEVVQSAVVRIGEKNAQTAIIQTKNIRIANPTDAEDVTMFYTPNAITVTEMYAVLVGSSTPSVTWTIRHGSDRSATGNEVVTSGTTTTNTTSVDLIASFNDETISGDSFVWLETTAKSGTVTELFVTIKYTED